MAAKDQVHENLINKFSQIYTLLGELANPGSESTDGTSTRMKANTLKSLIDDVILLCPEANKCPVVTNGSEQGKHLSKLQHIFDTNRTKELN